MAELAAARDRLDAEEAERRRREDDAFERYARADAEAARIAAERDAAIADLEAQSRRVSDDSAARLGEIEQRQCEILAELHTAGRKADDLAAMFGLAVKRVRTLLRQARRPAELAAAAAAPQARTVNDPAPSAAPAATEDSSVAAGPAIEATDPATRPSD